jgi:hypothetical protein
VAFVNKTTKKTYINENKLRFLNKNSKRTVTGVVCSEMQPPGFVLLLEICTLPEASKCAASQRALNRKLESAK